MRGPSEGLHEGPALGRGGRGKGAPPQPVAGPRGRDRHAAPPPGRQEAAPGDQRAPCKFFVQPIFSLFSVQNPDICTPTENHDPSTVLDSVGISGPGISVVLH